MANSKRRSPSNTAAKKPRIITLDIETAPLESYHWGLWDQNIGLEMVQKDWTILSFCAKWLHEDKVVYRDTGGRGKNRVRDDSALLKELWTVLDEADVIVAQNGVAFDLKKINSRLIMKGFKPYSSIRVIDTMLVAKKHFAFTSNKLAWLSKQLTSAPKSEHKLFPGFELWSECLKDNPIAWAEMKKYNIRDVVATEELYLKLRPWIDGHPNVAIYSEVDEMLCPRCGSNHVQKAGYRINNNGKYQRYHCQNCGGWASGKTSLVDKKIVKNQIKPC